MRSSGFVSRKTRALGISALLFAFSLFLTAYSSRNPQVGQIGSAIITTLVSPVQRVSSSVTSYIGWVWSSYVDLMNAKKENLILRAELERRLADNVRLRELEIENNKLKKLLDFKEDQKVKGVVAHVIGFEMSSWVHAITIDKGKKHGVAIGLPVVKENGIVGQVISTGPNQARVLLVIDHASAVDVFVQRTRARGMLVGRGLERSILDYVSKEDDVQPGDTVITSGVDGVFPKGLMVGTVSSVEKKTRRLFQDITLEPVTDLRRLEVVYVLQKGGEAQ